MTESVVDRQVRITVPHYDSGTKQGILVEFQLPENIFTRTALAGGMASGAVTGTMTVQLVGDRLGSALFPRTTRAEAWDCTLPENQNLPECNPTPTQTRTPTATPTAKATATATTGPGNGEKPKSPTPTPTEQSQPPSRNEGPKVSPPTTPTPVINEAELCAGVDLAHGHIIVHNDNEFVQLFPSTRFGFDQWTPQNVQKATTTLTPQVRAELKVEYEARCAVTPPPAARPPSVPILPPAPGMPVAPPETISPPPPAEIVPPPPAEMAPPPGQEVPPPLPEVPMPPTQGPVQGPLPGGIESAPIVLGVLALGGRKAFRSLTQRLRK